MAESAGREGRRACIAAVLAAVALGVTSLAVVPAAHAQAHKGGGGPRHASHPPPQQPPAGGARGLSPEERRQLRRDIRDAGRDVYRPGKG